MTHFYGTEEELNLWLAQKTEQGRLATILGHCTDISEISFDDFIQKNHAKI